jgi:hypothetical protein
MFLTDTLIARRERRARRKLHREGYALRKSRNYQDCYSIVNVRHNALMYHYHEVPLDQIEAFLAA